MCLDVCAVWSTDALNNSKYLTNNLKNNETEHTKCVSIVNCMLNKMKVIRLVEADASEFGSKLAFISHLQ